MIERRTWINGFPNATVYNITGISQSSPGIVTFSAITHHRTLPVANGQTINVTTVNGMRQVNNQSYVIGSLYNNRGFPIDTTNFDPYISGGQINIYSFPETAREPPGLMFNAD